MQYNYTNGHMPYNNPPYYQNQYPPPNYAYYQPQMPIYNPCVPQRPPYPNFKRKQSQRTFEKPKPTEQEPLGINLGLSTPEDIQKWRQERKQNYPTIDKIKKDKKITNKTQLKLKNKVNKNNRKNRIEYLIQSLYEREQEMDISIINESIRYIVSNNFFK